jgi:LysM repeat protein
MIAVTVVAGDTLSGIASAHGDSLGAVEAANPQIGNPNLIYVGNTVYIPGAGSSAPQSAPSWSPAPTHTSSPSYVPPAPSGGGSGGASDSSLSDVPGVPSSFAACVAERESSDGTNAAYNGGDYGIITASGINVNGQSLSAQKAAFSQLYKEYGTAPWAPSDGC